MYPLRRLSLVTTLLGAAACSAPAFVTPQPEAYDLDERTRDQAVVAWLHTDDHLPVWLEEQLAPWPQQAGDRDLGLRQIVRRTEEGTREVLWSAPAGARLTSAVVSKELSWAAVFVDADRRPGLARGDRQGLHFQQLIDAPGLAADPAAWFGSLPPDALRVGLLSEDSLRIAGSVDAPVVSLHSEHGAILAFRFRWSGGQYEATPYTLISPALLQTPYLPIDASYDSFDAVVHDFGTRLASADSGAAYVALPASAARLRRHNQVFGTQLQPLRSDADLSNRPSDLLVSRIHADGHIEWTRLVGIADVDDEVYAIAAGPGERLALVGRTRRERGRDNSEWHMSLHTLDAQGGPAHSRIVDLPGNGIAQTVAFTATGALLVGGTADWLQNPSGISLYRQGSPFLLQLDLDSDGQPGEPQQRDDLLPRTSGHAELRTLAVGSGSLWLGGLENGPLTHTGDNDLSLIRADGWRARRPRP